jgi:large subunit ribosomal protein L25
MAICDWNRMYWKRNRGKREPRTMARKVRRGGKIPAVVYGAGLDSLAITVDPRHVLRILHSESGHNTIFDLEIGGGSAAKAMIVDWQYEPVKRHLLHIDLKRIAMDKVLRVSVPVILNRSACGRAQARAAYWTRCCAKWRSSACRATFPATLMWT